MGIQGLAWKLLQSFLSGRSQTVDLDGHKSTPFSLPCGVPQGASLSPTLFNIYMIPLATLIRSFGFSLTSYADVTQIVLSFNDANERDTGARFYDCMTAIANWMASNCLKLNSSKTEVIVFGNNPHVWTSSWWPSDLGSCPIPTPKAKNLGVIVDSRLSFREHVSSVVSSCFHILRTLKKIKPYLSEGHFRTVVTVLIMSRLDYCNGLYLNAHKQQINRLQIIQNAAARLLLDIPKFTSVRNELIQLHWLSVKQRLRFKALCIVFKAVNGLGPDFLRQKFKWYAPGRPLHSSGAKHVCIPTVKRANWGGRNFTTCASKSWNDLPFLLKNFSDYFIFRKALKTWLFTN